MILAILIYVMPVCPQEDSMNCYWDASARGNHIGNSFVTIFNQTYYIGG